MLECIPLSIALLYFIVFIVFTLSIIFPPFDQSLLHKHSLSSNGDWTINGSINTSVVGYVLGVFAFMSVLKNSKNNERIFLDFFVGGWVGGGRGGLTKERNY